MSTQTDRSNPNRSHKATQPVSRWRCQHRRCVRTIDRSAIGCTIHLAKLPAELRKLAADTARLAPTALDRRRVLLLADQVWQRAA